MSLFFKLPPFISEKHSTRDLLFLVPAAFFFLFYRLGAGSLGGWDEAIYAQVAKEMVHSADWLHMRFNAQLWLSRPPLHIWATAFFFKLLGVTEFSARVFPALCGVGTVCVTYLLGRKLFDRWVGFVGALVLLSTSHFIQYGRLAMPDMPLTFLITSGLYLFWVGQQYNRYLIFSGIVFGLAVMVIGFQAFFVFPLIWLYLVMSERQSLFGRSTYWMGLMVAVCIALPWHLYHLLQVKEQLWQPPAYDAIGPLTAFGAFSTRDFFYYVNVLTNKDHPWILFGIFSAPYFVIKALRERSDESIFLSVWIFFTLLVISLIKIKRYEYVIPMYPAISLTVAFWVCRIFQDRSVVWVKLIFLVVMALHIPYSHILDQDHSPDIKALAAEATKRTPPFIPIYVFDPGQAAAVSFYMQRPGVHLGSALDFKQRSADKDFYCVLQKADLSAVGGVAAIQRSDLTIWAASGDILFIGPKS